MLKIFPKIQIDFAKVQLISSQMYNWQAIILCGLFAHNTIQILISAIQILQKHN